MHHIKRLLAKSFRQRRILPIVKNILLPLSPLALLLCVFVGVFLQPYTYLNLVLHLKLYLSNVVLLLFLLVLCVCNEKGLFNFPFTTLI